MAELISARKKKNASKYADTLDDLPNEGTVVFTIYRFLDRRTCRAYGPSCARFPLQVSSLMDPLPRSSTMSRRFGRASISGTHMPTQRTPKTRARRASCFSRQRYITVVITLTDCASPFLLGPVASAICNPVRRVCRYRRLRWASSSASIDTWASLDLT